MISVIYARESSDDTNKAPPIEMQVNRAKQYIMDNNLVLSNTYIDDGYSGGDWNRPSFNSLIKHAKGNMFKLVIVWHSDRIARDTEQFLYFYRNLKENHIQLYSLNEGWITMDTVGDTAKNISIAMAAELFRKITSDKVRAAYQSKLRDATKKGIKVGWGRKGKEYPIERIMQLYRSGLGYRKIGTLLGFNYQSIKRAIKSQVTKSPPNSAIQMP